MIKNCKLIVVINFSKFRLVMSQGVVKYIVIIDTLVEEKDVYKYVTWMEGLLMKR